MGSQPACPEYWVFIFFNESRERETESSNFIDLKFDSCSIVLIISLPAFYLIVQLIFVMAL